MKKQCERLFFSLLLVIGCLIMTTPISAQAAERRTVRVGIFDADIGNEKSGENQSVSFQKEYLEAVAEYANWNYVYM